MELRANGSSGDTDLGGGDHGYLGLILSDPEYARIVPTPAAFRVPVWPGALLIDANATPIEAVRAKEHHREMIHIYRECKNVEKSLLRHIQNALEEKYIEHMVDKNTGLIEHDIPTVLEYLFANYGKVPSEEGIQKELEVLNISFNPADPMVLLYRPIEQLQKLAISAKNPYSSAQLLELGITLIRNTRDLEKGLRDWNSKPEPDKTWPEFKIYFKTAQTELKDIRGPTMQQAGYHHANMMAAQLRTTMTDCDTEMLAMLQGLAEQDANPPQAEVIPQPAPAANAATNQDIQLEMLRILQEIQNTYTGRAGRGGRGGRGGQGDNNSNRNTRTPDNATFNRRVTNMYCHTYGGCNHNLTNCTRKAAGHKDGATMHNRLGGSNVFCQHVGGAVK